MNDAAAQAPSPPSEEDLRAAYEAELNRISSSDLILQTAASLLNLGARRLGLTGAPEDERDLEQVRDAIDGVRGLMPILERRCASEVGKLRGALSQLQLAYAREAQSAPPEQPDAAQTASAAKDAGAADAGAAAASQPDPAGQAPQRPQTRKPGPAESSGQLWVPGR